MSTENRLTAIETRLAALAAAEERRMIVAVDPTKHICIVCPVEVRGLYATAHNAITAIRHGSDWSRTDRKIMELEESLQLLRPFIDAHFADHPGSPL